MHRLGEYVADVLAVLDATRADRAVVVGYSAGARVAYQFAASHPERCIAVVGIGNVPSPDDDPEPNRGMAAYLREIGMRAVMEEFSRAENEPAPQWLIDNLAATETEMFAQLLEAWADEPSAWKDLPTISAPTLLVVGEHDQDDEAAERAARRLPHGRAVVLPEYGHLQTFWHGEVTGPSIVEFLHSLNP
jgi:pimeloyl-ACP methyl ester carboxylesterase